MWRKGEQATMNGVMGVIGRPFLRWQIIDTAHRQRVAMAKLAAVTTCSVDGSPAEDIRRWNLLANFVTPNLDASWSRLFRSIPEREATMNAMRIAEGLPIVAKSACSGETWRYENDHLTFSRDVPKSNENETVMPLSLAIPARATRRST
jgi:hypothetical protein